MKFVAAFVLLLVAGHCHAIENKELYETVVQGSVTMPRGDEESLLVNLQAPIHFYTDKYDSIYVSPSIHLAVYHPVSCARLCKRKTRYL